MIFLRCMWESRFVSLASPSIIYSFKHWAAGQKGICPLPSNINRYKKNKPMILHWHLRHLWTTLRSGTQRTQQNPMGFSTGCLCWDTERLDLKQKNKWDGFIQSFFGWCIRPSFSISLIFIKIIDAIGKPNEAAWLTLAYTGIHIQNNLPFRQIWRWQVNTIHR